MLPKSLRWITTSAKTIAAQAAPRTPKTPGEKANDFLTKADEGKIEEAIASAA